MTSGDLSERNREPIQGHRSSNQERALLLYCSSRARDLTFSYWLSSAELRFLSITFSWKMLNFTYQFFRTFNFTFCFYHFPLCFQLASCLLGNCCRCLRLQSICCSLKVLTHCSAQLDPNSLFWVWLLLLSGYFLGGGCVCIEGSIESIFRFFFSCCTLSKNAFSLTCLSK